MLFMKQSLVSYRVFRQQGAQILLPQPLQPEISVLIPVFDRVELLLACLTHLQASFFKNFETIILNNGSADETAAFCRMIDGIHVIENSVNVGFVAACNQMAKKAKGDFLLFLNSDAFVTPAALDEALKVLKSTSGVGAVGAKLVSMDGSLQEAGCRVYSTGETELIVNHPDPFHLSNNYQQDVDYCSAAFLMTPKKVFDALKGFDESYTYGYFEDVDYSFRLRAQGFRTVYVPKTVVFHVKNASHWSVDRTSTVRKNRELFITRHLSDLINQPSRSEVKKNQTGVLVSTKSRSSKKFRRDTHSHSDNLYQMMWHLNEACNFNCPYCVLDTVDVFHPDEHPFCGAHTPEHISSCFDRTGKKWRIHMSGGEPFLYPEFIGLCTQLTNNHMLSINTNLSTDNVFSWADVIASDMVHSINANIHMPERIKREKGCERFIEKVHYLQKRKFRVRVVYVAYPPLMKRIEQDFDYLRSKGISSLLLKVFRGAYAGSTFPDSYTKRDRRLFSKLGLTTYEKNILDGITGFKGELCTSGQNAFHMDVYGNLRRCNTIKDWYGNLLLEKYGFDELPSRCTEDTCQCPYQAYKFVLQ
jgi:GT2 family glycosyltransferase/organic radical activating enzyme